MVNPSHTPSGMTIDGIHSRRYANHTWAKIGNVAHECIFGLRIAS